MKKNIKEMTDDELAETLWDYHLLGHRLEKAAALLDDSLADTIMLKSAYGYKGIQ